MSTMVYSRGAGARRGGANSPHSMPTVRRHRAASIPEIWNIYASTSYVPRPVGARSATSFAVIIPKIPHTKETCYATMHPRSRFAGARQLNRRIVPRTLWPKRTLSAASRCRCAASAHQGFLTIMRTTQVHALTHSLTLLRDRQTDRQTDRHQTDDLRFPL